MAAGPMRYGARPKGSLAAPGRTLPSTSSVPRPAAAHGLLVASRAGLQAHIPRDGQGRTIDPTRPWAWRTLAALSTLNVPPMVQGAFADCRLPGRRENAAQTSLCFGTRTVS